MQAVVQHQPKTRGSKRKGQNLEPRPAHYHAGYPYPLQYPAPQPGYYYAYPYPPYQYPYAGPPCHPPIPGSSTVTSPPTDPPSQDKRQKQPPRLVSKNSPPKTTEPEETKITVEGGEETVVPHENDVLMGRGGKNNTHVGNERLRQMARDMREVYIKSRKKDKTNMARQLVHKVLALTPPGRFLQRDPSTMIWEEVGIDIARHKTSQCLRDAASEKNSLCRAKPEVEPAMDTQCHGVITTEEPIPVDVIEEPVTRASTPVHSNMAHTIEPSPPRRQSIGAAEVVRNRLQSWESTGTGCGSVSLAQNLIESWENNNQCFVRNRRGSLESTGSTPLSASRFRMYTWESNNSDPNSIVAGMDVEDAVLIPPEELLDADEVAELLDVSQLDDEMEMQIWQPDMYEESESPFDTEFF